MQRLPYIAIIRDGESDFLVLKRLLSVLFERYRNASLEDENFLNLKDLSPRDIVEKFVDKGKSENYAAFGKQAEEFRRRIKGLLHAGLKALRNEKEAVSNRDILILYTDAELALVDSSHYNDDNRHAYSLRTQMQLAIDEFYQALAQQYEAFETLPFIVPIILFPSSEILVAAFIGELGSKNDRKNYRKYEAIDLKQYVYDSKSIHEVIHTGQLEKKLNAYIVNDEETINRVYKELPELRTLLHILAAF